MLSQEIRQVSPFGSFGETDNRFLRSSEIRVIDVM